MPKVTIDGRCTEVEAGTTILKAARALGIDIPVFCYHDGLSVAANCRMCLVEVKGVNKPVPSCEMVVRDGMEVFTDSPLAIAARRHTVEFILVNHPVDCPICDQAGECVLQDHYMAHDFQASRINVRKVHKSKALPLGPNVVLDRERCINCTRCVRFCKEVSKTELLVQVKRGNDTEISVFPGKTFDDPYSLCTVDICPVGALTSRDFRFRQRVWWLKSTRAICPECSRGCNVFADHNNNTIFRLRPALNPEVNSFWACDAGRLAFHRSEVDRFSECRIWKADGELRLDVEETSRLAGQNLARVLAQGRGLGVVVSASASLEDAFCALKLAYRAGSRLVYLGARPAQAPDMLLRLQDADANLKGIRMLSDAMGMALVPVSGMFADGRSPGAVVVVGKNYDLPQPNGEAPEFSVVTGVHESQVCPVATYAIPTTSHYEQSGFFVNTNGHVQYSARVVEPARGVRPAHVFLRQLALIAGLDLGVRNLAHLRDEITSLLKVRLPGQPGTNATEGGESC